MNAKIIQRAQVELNVRIQQGLTNALVSLAILEMELFAQM